MATTIASTDVGGTGLSTVGTNGQVLTSNGTTLSWQTPSAGTSFSAGTTGFTPNTATTGTVTLGGTLVIANGGTGLTSFTAGQIHYGSFSTSSNLFWDSTNNRLGIGTSSPTLGLDVVSTSGATAKFTSPATSGVAIYLNNSLATPYLWSILNGNVASNIFSIKDENVGAVRLAINTSGAIGVGTTPSYGTTGQVLTSQGSGAPPAWISAPYSIDYLVVAGGGAGGLNAGAGGGAGGYLYGTFTVTASTAYSLVVGAGGASSNNNGSNSTGFGLTAIGGGGGTNNNGAGNSGGSGGGGSAGNSGGSGTSGQGNKGGDGNGQDGADRAAGGGGGAGAAGQNVVSSTQAGQGGNGLTWSNLVAYAGGGGGSAHQGGLSVSGGTGGGGAGGVANYTSGGTAGTAGSTNTGGGGGGGSGGGYAGGAGGSGIVIVRYFGSQRGTGGTITSSGGYTYHTFTSSGTFTS